MFMKFHQMLNLINACPAEPRFILFYENTVDSDQLVSTKSSDPHSFPL